MATPSGQMPRGGPPIRQESLEEDWKKGREFHKTFIETMAKEKGYLDWIRFLFQFLDHDDPRFDNWVAFYEAAMKIDLFCKGTEPDPKYRHLLDRFPRSPDVEDQWYRRYARGWIEAFWSRVQKEEKNPDVLDGIKSMDSVMAFPDRLIRRKKENGEKG